jgi:hypothetical protein
MKTTTILAALLLTGAAHAEQVWRCGSTYSQQPCAGGTPVQVEDARSKAQSQQAGQQAQRDAKTAQEMEKSRLALEAKAPQASVIPLAERPATEAPSTPEVTRPEARKAAHAKKKSAKSEYFTAVAPGDKKAGKKKSAKKKKSA